LVQTDEGIPDLPIQGWVVERKALAQRGVEKTYVIRDGKDVRETGVIGWIVSEGMTVRPGAIWPVRGIGMIGVEGHGVDDTHVL
jgi:hypothetical protein